MNEPEDIEKQNPPDLDAQETVDSTTLVNTNTTSYDFVDYTPPEKVKILPPAKYKLCFLITVLVLLAIWLADEANLVEFLMFGGWLSPEAALFVFLCITVFVLTYGALDLMVAVFKFRRSNKNGPPKVLGIGAWLKAPRHTWMYRYQQNLLVEILTVFIRILEDGFRMFDAPPCPRNATAKTIPTKCKNPCAKGKTEGCRQEVLKIEHRIDPDKIQDYNKWEDRMGKLISESATGLVSVERRSYTSEDGNEIEIIGLETETTASKDISAEIGGLLRVIKLTFQDIDCLNEWMVLPRRRLLMNDLQRFLVVPDVIQICLNRELPDAFTDLMIRQGESVPNLPPLKWKVWWLITVALYISINWVSSFMAHYYEFWGLNGANIRIQDLVNTPIVVIVNTYILLPLLLFVFDHWTKRTEAEAKVKTEPWRTLYNGFQSIWWKTLLTFAYYGGMAIAWIVMANK